MQELQVSVDLPEPQDVINSLSDLIGRELEHNEIIAFFEFAKTKRLDLSAEAAGITKAKLKLWMSEPWWMIISTKFLYAYQEEFVHGMMSTGRDLLTKWKEGIDGAIPPDMFKQVIKAVEIYSKLGRDEMKPLLTTKHEIDIKSEKIVKELHITADLTNKMTDDEIMDLTLYGKMPQKKIEG